MSVAELRADRVTRLSQFDNPIVKPAAAAGAAPEEGSGANGLGTVAPRQRIEIVSPADGGDVPNASGGVRSSTRELLVHLPFKPRRRAVEAGTVMFAPAARFVFFKNPVFAGGGRFYFSVLMSLHTHPTRAHNLSERNVQAQPAFPLDIVITVTDHRDGGRVHSVCARN